MYIIVWVNKLHASTIQFFILSERLISGPDPDSAGGRVGLATEKNEMKLQRGPGGG